MTEQQKLTPIEAPSAPAPLNLAEVLAPGETLSFLDLPRLRVPAGGATTWELPDGGAAKVIEAVILHRQPTRAYWPTAFDGATVPPACSSADAVIGIGDPGGECSRCPYAQFGSDGGKGQACHLITRVFLDLGGPVPWLLQVPPSGFGRLRQFVIQLALTRNLPYWGVMVRISLEKAQSASGIAYSTPAYEVANVLGEDARARAEHLRSQLLPVVGAIPVGA